MQCLCTKASGGIPKNSAMLEQLIIVEACLKPKMSWLQEALAIMLSSISGHWKHPIAYFLQNKIYAEVFTQLMQDCIGLLYAECLNVLALVFDGTFGNQSTAVQLGYKIVSV